MANSKFSHLLKLFLLTGLLLFQASSALAWPFTIPDCAGCGSRAETVVVDSAGDVIAAGRGSYGGDVVKLSGTTGQLIWQFNASHNLSEQGVNAIALDSHGDVFVLFATSRGVTKISGTTGARIWQRPIGGTIAACISNFVAIVVDRDDNVVATGTAGCLLNVAKLDGNSGDEQWHYEREGIGKAVAVDPFGNVAAAGIMNRNFAVTKLSGGNGGQLWQKEINGAGNFSDVFEEANAVAMDEDGSVVVAGVTSNEVANFRDFTVARYQPDGTIQWTKIIDGRFFLQTGTGMLINQSNDIAYAVTIDHEGSVIAAGSIQSDNEIPANPQTQEHFHVVKITSDGNTVWSRAAEDPAFGQVYPRGHAFALSINAVGNVVAAGVHNGRFYVVKFWGRTGGLAWRRQITSGSEPSGNGNQALKVAMDAASDVIAAGETLDSDGISKFKVVKLNRKDGLDYNGDAPPDNVPDIVLEHAPLVFLYPDDQYRPGNPITFISNSSLGWSHTLCTSDLVAQRGSVEPQRLGQHAGIGGSRAAYSNNPNLRMNGTFACAPDRRYTFKSSDYTRPYDTERKIYLNPDHIWENWFYERDGFFLDPANDDTVRNGIPAEPGNSIYPGAPVFYEYVQREYITYWFFYPYDRFEAFGVGVQQHEGDWERISVQLDRNEVPINVYYYHHEGGSREAWDSVDKYDSSHPIVFSAKGAHGSYPRACRIDPRCSMQNVSFGPVWLTWNDLFKVEAQPWYGFGGAWGEVGTGQPVLGASNYTGPLGPSIYKRSETTWDQFPHP